MLERHAKRARLPARQHSCACTRGLQLASAEDSLRASVGGSAPIRAVSGGHAACCACSCAWHFILRPGVSRQTTGTPQRLLNASCCTEALRSRLRAPGKSYLLIHPDHLLTFLRWYLAGCYILSEPRQRAAWLAAYGPCITDVAIWTTHSSVCWLFQRALCLAVTAIRPDSILQGSASALC